MAPSASRVFSLLELLQANHRMTVPEIAERLDVNERTVRRYVGTLAELGIPVTAERGRHGGYRLLPGFKLPPLMLTDDEAVAVVLGLVAADRLGLAADAPATASAEAKVVRVLPPVLAGRLAALRESLGFTMRRPEKPMPDSAADGDPPDTDTLLTLGAATRAHERLTLTYRSRTRTTTTRDFDPYGLVFHATRWYVVGHDHGSDEIRSFRVDRIVEAKAADATFEPPPGFDAVAHINRQFAGLPWHWEIEVLIEAGLAEVRRLVPAATAEVTETAGGVRLSCRAHSLPGMAQMLAGMRWPFTIVQPDELREAVAEHAIRLAMCAARSPDE
jgi:predicted DNA-binding transcriptional regulator YafY